MNLYDHLYDHLYDPLSLGLYIQHISRSLWPSDSNTDIPPAMNLGQEQVIRDSVSLGVSMSVVRRLKAESIGLKKMEAWPDAGNVWERGTAEILSETVEKNKSPPC